MREIKELLDKHNPHILTMSEAQIRDEDKSEIIFEKVQY